jgi:uncharacterized protein
MRCSFRLHFILLLAIAFAGPTPADTDPSLSQVYEAVRTGQLEQAQKMMNEVLHDHPKSAKAHYVAAEVNAASGNLVRGRQELHIAQELAPGLPFAAPESMRNLRDKLSRIPVAHAPPGRQAEAGFPWSVLAVIVVGMGVVVALVSKATRKPTNGDSQPREAEPPPAAGSPATAAAAGLAPTEGTAVGSNIAGGLAGGLAAGAGIAAGEEIARNLLNSGTHEANPPPAGDIAEEQHEDDHVAGRDFGVSGGASSWDDKDQASGGDDWT